MDWGGSGEERGLRQLKKQDPGDSLSRANQHNSWDNMSLSVLGRHKQCAHLWKENSTSRLKENKTVVPPEFNLRSKVLRSQVAGVWRAFPEGLKADLGGQSPKPIPKWK
ncbi:uncharacterized [Tachysurus ichikawai]